MKQKTTIVLLVTLVFTASCDLTTNGGTETELVTLSNARLVLATAESAKPYILTNDDYLANISPTDRQLYMRSPDPVSQETYLDFLATQTRDWTEEEAALIRRSVAELAGRIADRYYKMLFPPEIVFVKTSGDEIDSSAALAGYCRSNNIVVLMANGLAASDPAYLPSLIWHELFHIYSRNNPAARGELYKVIHFETGPLFAMPDDLHDRKISNPDTMWDLYYITLNVEGDDYKLMPFCLANLVPGYDPAKGLAINFFNQLGFVAVTIQGNRMVPIRQNGDYVIFTYDAVKDALHEKIGDNTDYDVHPEEIMATTFHLYMKEPPPNLPSPWVPAGMEKVLKGREH